MKTNPKLPLVYSCSGASSAAQMANHLAVKLDRLQVAEMSCIAGVGGNVKPLVCLAKSGWPIFALDGCPFYCAAQILKRYGLKAKGVDQPQPQLPRPAAKRRQRFTWWVCLFIMGLHALSLFGHYSRGLLVVCVSVQAVVCSFTLRPDCVDWLECRLTRSLVTEG